MGLIPHEAPRLSTKAPVPYPAEGAENPLETGMVISIETAIHHPRRGFIKLEDTVAVTDAGWEAFGDHGRGWNIGGRGSRPGHRRGDGARLLVMSARAIPAPSPGS